MNNNDFTIYQKLVLVPVAAIIALCLILYYGGAFGEVNDDIVFDTPTAGSTETQHSELESGGSLTEASGAAESTVTEATASAAIPTNDERAAETAATAAVTTTQPANNDGERRNARFVENPDYLSDYYIVVFLQSQNVIVYGKGEDGGYNRMSKCFICSTGCAGHSTRTGHYSIIRKYRWRLLVGDVYGQYSTGFSSSYLFHSTPYYEEDPSTLDEDEYDKLGQPASHGCVRLCVRDSKWIYENCDFGTQINIVDAYNETMGEPLVPRIDDTEHSGWDPSDDDKDSPYSTK